MAMSTGTAALKSKLKLYGVPLSQPVRSVAWTMIQLGVPFDFQLAVPGMKNKVGTRNEVFQSLTPWKSSNVPVLCYPNSSSNGGEDRSLVLSESSAILTHLSERYGESSSSSLYIPPPGSDMKALQDVYLNWHHTNTRMVAKLFQRKVRPDLQTTAADGDDDSTFQQELHEMLSNLDQGWLGGNNFLGGSSQPTIADIIAYGELSTVTMTNLLSLKSNSDEDDTKSYDNISSWMTKMRLLPYHDDVHIALTMLGDLSSEDLSTKDVGKRLGAATKAGVKAFADLQQSSDKSG